MKAAVYDTYVPRKDGGTMHFDIVVPESVPFEKVLEFGKQYLAAKGQAGQPLSTKECRFCHVEEASPAMLQAFEKQGYFIVEMEGCRV